MKQIEGMGCCQGGVHIQKKLINSALANSWSRARLLAAFTKESGYWLDAPPISSLGLRIEDEGIRITVGLHIGVPRHPTFISAYIVGHVHLWMRWPPMA